MRNMKILAIADRPARQPIPELISQHHPDIICTLGDLGMHELRALEAVTNIPKLGVYGNHDSGLYMESLGIQNMHLQTFEYNGWKFGGFEGSVKYKDADAPMYTQTESIEMLKDFPRVDILLTHAPPFGINDEPDDPTHAGFKGLLQYVEEKNPGYLLHGHTYPTDDQLIIRHGETNIIYVFADKIIKIST